MAFVDLVKSVYQDQHKAKPKALTSVEEGKNVRIQKQAKERRSKRVDTFFTNRAMEVEDDILLTPQSDAGPVPKKDAVSDPRKRQMLLWKEERMKRKKMEPKKPPPFKAGVVKHHIAPLQDEIFKNPIKARPIVQEACHRVTRSTTRAHQNNYSAPLTSTYQQKSFAPANAKFHAPKITVNDKKLKLRYTPKKARRGIASPLKLTTVLNSIQPSKTSVAKPFDFKLNMGKNTNIKAITTKVTRNNKVPSKAGQSTCQIKKKEGSGVSKEKRLSGVRKNKRLSGKRQSSRRSSSKRNSEIVPSENIESLNSKVITPKRVTIESTATVTPTNKRLSKIVSGSLDKSINKSTGSLNSSSEGRNKSENLVISSPFVTVARGKTNQRRETLCKIKLGYVEMSPEKTAQYFRLQLDGEINRLQSLCDKWRNYQTQNSTVLSEDANDLINLAIGQTRLLISKKFEQFRGLVIRCENKEERDGEGVVTAQDLQGFWDMVYMQVENVDIRFHKLDDMKSKDWKEDDVVATGQNKKKSFGKLTTKCTKAKTKPSSGLKAMIQAARMKSKTSEPTLPPVTCGSLKPETVTFNGGFFSVISPVKTNDDQNIKTPGKRTSMLKTVVDSEAKKRLSAKTPESAKAILKASCLAKHVANNVDIPAYMLPPIDLNKTPAKSILKTPAKLNTSAAQSMRKSLKVLFSSDLSDEDDKQVISKSKRLSSGDNWTVTCYESEKQQKDIHVPERVTTKKGRRNLTRQNAIIEDNDENVPPSNRNKTKNEPTPVKIYNTRRRKSINDNLLEISLSGDKEVIIEPQVLKPSRRSKRKSVDDGALTFETLAASTMSNESTPTVVKKSRRKSMDERQSINLISFSPDKPTHNTRYTLRRMSTNAS